MTMDPKDAYGERVNGVVYSQSTATFTRQDWIDLAMAALDQAGCSATLQGRIEEMLPSDEGES